MSKLRKNNAPPKLQEVMEKMCIDLHRGYPFFGEYNLMLDFKNATVYCSECKGKKTITTVKDETIACRKCDGTGYGKSSIETCAVNVSTSGMNFYWNENFLNNLTLPEVAFVDIHELFHLIYNHSHRTIAGRLDPRLTNIAQDMIINNTIWVDVMKKQKNDFFVQIPTYKKSPYNDERKLTGKNLGVFLPNEYKGEHIFEYLYLWLKEKHEEYKEKKEKQQQPKCKTCGGTGEKPDKNKPDGQNDGGNTPDKNGDKGDNKCDDCKGSGDGKKKPEYGQYGADGVDTFSLDSIFDMMDENEGQFMDSHISDEVPEEVRDQMTQDAIERLRSRGLVTGDMEQTVKKLRKKRKDYLKEIKRAISNEIMGINRQKSIVRPNRKGIDGLKGHIKTKSQINVILDTSGSMSGLHDKVLSYIYRNDITCNLIQCDTHVQSVKTIKKKAELEVVKLKGFGGTVIQPAVDIIVEKFNKYNTVLLTDGQTDSLDFSRVRGRVLIISTTDECPITAKPKKGLRQIKVDEKYQ